MTTSQQRDLIKALLLAGWLWLPNLAVIGTDHLQNNGDVFALLLLSLMLLAAPLLLAPSWRWYFLLWSPLALLVLPYTYLTLIYSSVPGDALLSSALHTSPAMSWQVASAFGWRVWLVPLILLIYVLLACSLPRSWTLSAPARKRLLAALLLTIMLALLGRQTVAQSVRLPPLLEQSTLNLAFPSGLAMSLARIARQQQGDAGFVSVHGRPPAAGKAPPVLVVLVIGESLRSDHLGINGYPRNTTPLLAALGSELLSFADAASTANWTSQAVPGIVALPLGRQRASLPHTFAEAGFRTAWLSNQETLPFSHGLDVVEHAVSSQDFHLRTDANLLPLFTSFVRQAGPRQFAVLHLIGSHIPYEERYTAVSRIYTPTLRDRGITQPQAQHRQAVINSYDNTVIETDRLLARVIGVLRDDPRPAILLYTSDHGENLFDDARQLFMHAQTGPTRHDIHVPLLVWMNRPYRAAHPAIAWALQANHRKQVSHRDLFTTLLDAGGVRWDGREASHSLASPLYRERPRSVMVDLQTSVSYESLK
ncbi:phosphoethanolamine transferase [Duganella sp. sic0402]|uniref:phosphoethanolamine transferase n=1 Tax=Duganella sp. sic0402 TaxID=2854786 RepID=UPI001C447B71|nr:phosphoethanolamine transferase [Duganella sp. sic0402]MBV7538773.1 phosphoethanolamine transferase [Duganella sp. sic0402]